MTNKLLGLKSSNMFNIICLINKFLHLRIDMGNAHLLSINVSTDSLPTENFDCQHPRRLRQIVHLLPVQGRSE